MSMRFTSDLDKMIHEFDQWVDGNIARQKRELTVIADEFAANVSAHLPVGPSHRVGIAPGTLKASHRAYINETADSWEARITVGSETDYWMYVQAQQGGTFWHDEQSYIERMDRALRGDE